MLMHPEAQRKIQDELDEIVGRGNAPTSSAVQSMQYLDAAWKESLRLNPPIPTSESSRVARASRLIEAQVYRIYLLATIYGRAVSYPKEL